MQFVANEDIEAPVEFVFEQLSDFAALERSVLRHGAEVQRTDTMTACGPGMTWDASYDVRRTRLNMALELKQFDPPNGMEIEGRSDTLGGLITLDLVALSRLRTRISLNVNVSARTLPARLFLQSLKLARVHPETIFRTKVADFATRLEERYKSSEQKGTRPVTS